MRKKPASDGERDRRYGTSTAWSLPKRVRHPIPFPSLHSSLVGDSKCFGINVSLITSARCLNTICLTTRMTRDQQGRRNPLVTQKLETNSTQPQILLSQLEGFKMQPVKLEDMFSVEHRHEPLPFSPLLFPSRNERIYWRQDHGASATAWLSCSTVSCL